MITAAETIVTSWPLRTIGGITALGAAACFCLLKKISATADEVLQNCCQANATAVPGCPYNSSDTAFEGFCRSESNRVTLRSFAALVCVMVAGGAAVYAIAIRKCIKRCRSEPPQEMPLPTRRYSRLSVQYGSSNYGSSNYESSNYDSSNYGSSHSLEEL